MKEHYDSSYAKVPVSRIKFLIKENIEYILKRRQSIKEDVVNFISKNREKSNQFFLYIWPIDKERIWKECENSRGSFDNQYMKFNMSDYFGDEELKISSSLLELCEETFEKEINISRTDFEAITLFKN